MGREQMHMDEEKEKDSDGGHDGEKEKRESAYWLHKKNILDLL